MKKYLTFILSVCLLFSFACITGQAEEENVLYIEMTVEQEDDGVEVHLVDGRGGSVSTWPVMLELDGVQVDTILTDSEGYALFTYAIPEQTGEIACVAKDGQYDVFRFVGCRVVLEKETEPTQSEEETQTTTSTSETTSASDTTSTTVMTTTQTTTATTTVQSSTIDETTLTTKVDGDRVAIGIVPDTMLLSVSQSSVPEYRAKARMWMDKELYDSLVSVSSATLQLQLQLNETASDVSRFIVAKNADPAFASYPDDMVKGFAMDMSIAYVDETSNIPLEIEDGMYTVEIPVPAVLNTCTKFAVAVCKTDGLSQLIEVKPVNGVLNFTVQRFQTLAVIGLGDTFVSIQSLSQTPWLIVVVIAVGALLVIFGVLLLVLVTFRRRKAVLTDSTEELDDSPILFDEENKDLANDEEALPEVTVCVEEESDETVEISPECEIDTVAVEILDETEQQEESTASVQSQEINTSNSLDEMLDEVLNDLEEMDS